MPKQESAAKRAAKSDQPQLAKGQWRLSAKPRETTLREHGAHTIMGSIPFDVRQLDMQYRAIIGKQVEPRLNPHLRGRSGLVVIHCLAHSLTRLGLEDFTEMSFEECVLSVGRLQLVDVMYSTYVRLTMIDDGKMRVNLPDGARCRHCGGPVPRFADVDVHGLRVNVYDEPPTATYRMRYPWKLRGKELVETISLRSADLNHGMGMMTDDEMAGHPTNPGIMLAASIEKVNGKRATVRYDDLIASDAKLGHAMRDADFDALSACLEELIAGPAQEVAWRHACGKPLMVPVAWGPAFFGRGAVSVPAFT